MAEGRVGGGDRGHNHKKKSSSHRKVGLSQHSTERRVGAFVYFFSDSLVFLFSAFRYPEYNSGQNGCGLKEVFGLFYIISVPGRLYHPT